MNTRIRYAKTDDGLLKSTRVFVGAGGQEFSVVIDMAYAFEISDAATGATVSVGTASSLASAKIKAKKALMSLGCAFEGETRTRSVAESAA